jgi:hypothetical protein
MMNEGHDRVKRYRENYDKIAMVKAKYDPTNLFRINRRKPKPDLPDCERFLAGGEVGLFESLDPDR